MSDPRSKLEPHPMLRVSEPKLTTSELLSYTEHVIETRASGTFMKTSAKCYRPVDVKFKGLGSGSGSGPAAPQSELHSVNTNSGGIILMFAHGTGYHKEQWEPTIARLFQHEGYVQQQLLNQDSDLIGPDLPTTSIKEVWAVDCQNHGEAAVLNEGLISDDPGRWSSWDYADAFATLRVELGKDESYRNDKFVLIAHSASACAAVLATSFFPTPRLLSLAFHALILIEPAICPPHLMADGNQTEVYRAIAQIMPGRRDVWSSREEARAWLTRRLPWKMWDKEVLDVFVEHGLRDLPTAIYPSYPTSTSSSSQPPSSPPFASSNPPRTPSKAVTLKTPKLIETIAYTRGMQQAIPAVWRLNQICGNRKVGDSTAEKQADHGRMGQEKDGGLGSISGGEEDLGLVGGLDGGVHLIWGEIDDMFSRETKDALEDPAQGRSFASVTRMEGVGHLIVQQDPQRLAEVVCDVVLRSFGIWQDRLRMKPLRRSKL